MSDKTKDAPDTIARYVPEGYALVPIEPTPLMVVAGKAYVRSGNSDYSGIYKAMIKAVTEKD